MPSSLYSELKEESWTHNTIVTVPPRFSPFQAAPPTGNHLRFVVECDADGKTLQGTFAGCLYAFRHKLEDHGILGARTTDGQYVRVVAPLDSTKEEHRTWLLGTILRDVFHELVLGVEVAQRPAEDTPAYEFLNLLLDLPQVYVLP